MHIPFGIDILDVIFKGILIGVIVSAPMGPVGVLCVQRTINKGRWFGFATGIGATASDLIYALITGFGMSFAADIINNSQYRFYLQILGSVLLLVFGIYSFRAKPRHKDVQSKSKGQGNLMQNGFTAFMITVSNPLIILLFVACYAQMAFVLTSPLYIIVGYLSIIAGALLWWFGLTWLVDKIRTKFDNNGIVIINKVIGCIVTVISIIILLGTVFNLYTFSFTN